MRTRIVIIDGKGRVAFGIDTGWTTEQVEQWVREQTAIVRAAVPGEPTVVRLEPLAGGDEAVRPLRNVNAWRATWRALPDGRTELHALHDFDACPVTGEVSRREFLRQLPREVCRAFTVLHAPEALANRRGGVRGNRPPPSMDAPPPALRMNRHQRARQAREGA